MSDASVYHDAMDSLATRLSEIPQQASVEMGMYDPYAAPLTPPPSSPLPQIPETISLSRSESSLIDKNLPSSAAEVPQSAENRTEGPVAQSQPHVRIATDSSGYSYPGSLSNVSLL